MRKLDGRVILQTKHNDPNLELGNETNGKFLIDWLRWNMKHGRETKDWISSIRPVYSTSSQFTINQRIMSDADFCRYYGGFNCLLTALYKLVHYLPRRIGITDFISLPLKIYNFILLRVFPPNILYSGFGFYFIKR